MRTAFLLLILLLVLLPGCTNGAPPSDDPEPGHDACNEGYYVGCDDNPDAQYMLEVHGLHQFTNTSYGIAGAEVAIDAGMVVWADGGFGDPLRYWFRVVPDRLTSQVPLQSGGVRYGPYTSNQMVLHGFMPASGGERDFDAEQVWLWTETRGNEEVQADYSDHSLRPWKFSHPWALMIDFRPDNNYQNGLVALQVQTGTLEVLHPILRTDDSHYGGPHVADALGGGHSFLSMRYEGHFGEVTTSIVDVSLETGERREIANLTHTVLEMDASNEYLVLNARMADEAGIWLWNMSAEEWTYLGPGGFTPRVGGDWVVFLEQGTASSGWDTLIGIHIPTGERYVLGEEGDFQFAKWDTDGEYVVVHAEARRSFPRALQYQGAQLYWMHLPEIS